MKNIAKSYQSLNTKTMTTKTKAQPKQERKPKDEKFRVIPGRSLKGKDIMNRLKNRTIIPGYDGQYTLDEQFSKMKLQSKIDIARDHVKAQKEIHNLKTKLENQNVPSQSKIGQHSGMHKEGGESKNPV